MTLTDKVHTRLSRVTSSGRFISEIDGLRFVAIASVVMFHLRNYLVVKPVTSYATPLAQDWSARFGEIGHYGVQLFFIVSGFVLALPFASHYLNRSPAVNLKQYFTRRLTRLEPPYIVAMLGCFLLLVTVGGKGGNELWPDLTLGLGYLHTAVQGEPNPIILVAWSLEVEVQFYLLVPLLTTVFMIRNSLRRRSVICLVGLVTVLGQIFFMRTAGRLSWTILNYLQYFLAGFMLADLYLNELKKWTLQRNLWWDLVSIVGWLLLGLLLLCSWPDLVPLLFAPVAILPFCGAFGGRLSNRILTNRWITVIGGMCYTIYLIHFQLLSAFEKLVGKLALTKSFGINLLLHSAIFAPFLLIFSAIFFVIIERPCMKRNWPSSLVAKVRNVFESRRNLETPQEKVKA